MILIASEHLMHFNLENMNCIILWSNKTFEFTIKIFTDFERKVIKAAGELQKEMGCGVSFHPHRDVEAPFEIMRLYLEAGGTASKAVMSHLDRKSPIDLVFSLS